MSWKRRAKCAGDEDPRWINPGLIKVPAGMDQKEWRSMVAAGMCSGCPVIAECRQDILDSQDQDLIKGGYALPFGASNSSVAHEELYNEIRNDLGYERQPTRVDYLAQTYPKPCANGCGSIIRIPPMRKAKYPGTVIGILETDMCIPCYQENK